MKITVVPAQVTTVEDRVAGNLGFSQLILLAIPVFGGSLLYAAIPPIMEYSLFKLIVILTTVIIASIFAIRIKGKIILLWAIVLLRYTARPKYYLFNKNSRAYRQDYPEPLPEKIVDRNLTNDKERLPPLTLDIAKRAYVYTTLNNPMNQVEFDATKKGGLRVRINEIQEGQ